MRWRALKFLWLLVTSFSLLACGSSESNVAQGNRAGILHFGNGTEPQGLDPHVVTGIPESHIVRALFEGLTVKNPYTLESEPGVAQSWEVSADGLIVTFHLNPEARWSNGDLMTAQDYVWSWQRALSPAMGNQYAYMLYPVENAEAFATGKLQDFAEVGVKALDAHTLQVRLNAPTPYFIQLMDHDSTFAVHRPTIEKYGVATARFTPWTRVENIVGNARLQSSNGSIKVRGLEGKLDAKTSNSGIDLVAVVGDFTGRTSNGSITVDGLQGTFDGSTSNSSIKGRIEKMPGGAPLKADSSNGSIDLSLPDYKGQPMDIDTSNSSITLRLPAGINADLRASTSNSSLSNEFEMTSTGVISKNRIEGKIGSGGGPIRVSTSNGSIRIQKL